MSIIDNLIGVGTDPILAENRIEELVDAGDRAAAWQLVVDLAGAAQQARAAFERATRPRRASANRPGPSLAGNPPGCDSPVPASQLDGRCRCVVCGRCGRHAGNSHQGHHWRHCRVTGTMRDPHFCCPDDCELETAAGNGS